MNEIAKSLESMRDSIYLVKGLPEHEINYYKLIKEIRDVYGLYSDNSKRSLGYAYDDVKYSYNAQATMDKIERIVLKESGKELSDDHRKRLITALNACAKYYHEYKKDMPAKKMAEYKKPAMILAKADDFEFDALEKAKYTGRTGMPGHYHYEYSQSGKKKKGIDIGHGYEFHGVGRTKNGLKTVKIKSPGKDRITSLQTNTNMPGVHSNVTKDSLKENGGISHAHAEEIKNYHQNYHATEDEMRFYTKYEERNKSKAFDYQINKGKKKAEKIMNDPQVKEQKRLDDEREKRVTKSMFGITSDFTRLMKSHATADDLPERRTLKSMLDGFNDLNKGKE